MAGSEYEILGPFTSHRVIVSGRQVPFLEAEPANGGRIHLSLDDRYGLDISVADADRVIPFIADCIAVAMGYACHPREGTVPLSLPPFRRLTAITEMLTTPADASLASLGRGSLLDGLSDQPHHGGGASGNQAPTCTCGNA